MNAKSAPRWLTKQTARRLGFAGLAAASCSGPPGAGLLRGEPLGRFAVQATQSQGDCDATALGAPASFQFEVELSRQASEIFWDGRASGSLSASGEFAVSTQVRRQLEEGRCQLLRDDAMSGVLFPDVSGYAGFEGTMTYSFSGAGEDECIAVARAAASLPPLPCTLQYALLGNRIALTE